MSKKEWYFIAYNYIHTSKVTLSMSTSIRQTIENKHPLEWLDEMQTEYSEDGHSSYEYQILFWSLIPEEIALKMKEKFE